MTSIYDLKDDPLAHLDHPSHAIFFYLPRAALDMIADGAEAPHVDSLRFQTGVGIDDPVIRNLTCALLQPRLSSGETRTSALARAPRQGGDEPPNSTAKCRSPTSPRNAGCR